ncbi:aminoglycoside phosphotransferase [Sinomonas atrocyanea]|uniref:Aminoglycoside phosphotransferase n=1 Tax=Sinomonas atrocyanea TaxID=37927 RepID=A0A126ZW55_9MICC|nr:phosphotransferase [Sinomonas atrocyanea]AMM30784.1 aminoglycoside phosphotransferase [Sinomonas atrocyanea]GEB63830.1 aminoglycoside phosphotransferase [Sinomonas atrocyanea]GGG65167.1 aminoglycoside phosphotransferase [Sinomonas atrocyanea]
MKTLAPVVVGTTDDEGRIIADEHLKHPDPEERAAAARRLAREALPMIGIPADSPLQVLPVSENLVVRVAPDGRAPLVLRITPPHARTDDEIRSELSWIDALDRESDVSVAGVIAAPTGDSLLKVTDPVSAVTASVAVFRNLEGHEPEEDELPALMPDLGRISALLHEHSSRWARPARFMRGSWDTETAFGSRPIWGDWRAAVPNPADRAHLKRAEDLLVARLRSYGRGPDRFGLIHADLRTANLLVDDGHCSIIDFDDAGFGWWLYDLATALTFYENHPQRDAFIDSWLTAYRQVRPLAEEDILEIPSLLLFRRLLTLAFLGNNPTIEVSTSMLPGLPEQTCALAEEYLRLFG